MKACVVCAQPGTAEVWGYAVCRVHEADWRTNVSAPDESRQAGEVPLDALCAAWAASTRAFLVQRYREAKAAEKVAPAGSQVAP